MPCFKTLQGGNEEKAVSKPGKKESDEKRICEKLLKMWALGLLQNGKVKPSMNVTKKLSSSNYFVFPNIFCSTNLIFSAPSRSSNVADPWQIAQPANMAQIKDLQVK